MNEPKSADDLLRHVWNHMHGINVDGKRRVFGADGACEDNWIALSEMIGNHLEVRYSPSNE